MFEADRIEGWPDRLDRALAHHRAQTFELGSSDCAMVFLDAVRALTGQRPFDHLGPWASERAGLRALAASGVESVREYLDQHLPRVHPSAARRGDVGYSAATHPLCCPAVITGAEAMSRDEAGWIVFPRSLLTHCYRIGR